MSDKHRDPNAGSSSSRSDAAQRLALARGLAERFARTFGYPDAQRAQLLGPPLEGPLVLDRDGAWVEIYRWLGHGRGATSIQVELALDDDDASVYGTLGDRGLGPWKPSELP